MPLNVWVVLSNLVVGSGFVLANATLNLQAQNTTMEELAPFERRFTGAVN